MPIFALMLAAQLGASPCDPRTTYHRYISLPAARTGAELRNLLLEAYFSMTGNVASERLQSTFRTAARAKPAWWGATIRAACIRLTPRTLLVLLSKS